MSKHRLTLVSYIDPLPVILEDDPIHCDPYPFCGDPTCPCQQPPGNVEAFALLDREYVGGLLTFDEALRIIQARQVNS